MKHAIFAAIAPGDPQTMLNARRRRRELDQLDSRVWDVVVIGGGITGVGVALDAASRGLDTVLIESHDLAYGTSRWSSKLVHGGLRYLAKAQFDVAWESARERKYLMSVIAPHLARPMAQVVPLLPEMNSAVIGVGLRAADAMRRLSKSDLAAPSKITSAQARQLLPNLTNQAQGAWLSWDGQLIDDARLVIAVARTAAGYGAKILTHVQATQLNAGQVDFADTITGETGTINTRAIINATGAWADQLDDRIKLVRSRGTHLVVAASSLGYPTGALAVPVPGSISRFVFALPQPDALAFIGLTDESTDAPLDHPTATEAEIEFLIDVINTGLATQLQRSEVISTFAGYRPLLVPGHAKAASVSTQGSGAGVPTESNGGTADISRKHAVITGDVISVVGGKLTTYRRMAADAVDVITDRRCCTQQIPLVGAQPRLAEPHRLSSRFGSEAHLIAQLGTRTIGDTPVQEGEIRWALQAEGAITEADILQRRLRVDFVPAWQQQVSGEVTRLIGAASS